jgi:CheY-like chemotaxis protein
MINDQAAREASDPERPRMPRIDPMVVRVAIADDDPEAPELLSEILRNPAIEICKAASGAELVVLLAEQGPFDLVLFVSGVSSPDIQTTVERLGNARLLCKPIAVPTARGDDHSPHRPFAVFHRFARQGPLGCSMAAFGEQSRIFRIGDSLARNLRNLHSASSLRRTTISVGRFQPSWVSR